MASMTGELGSVTINSNPTPNCFAWTLSEDVGEGETTSWTVSSRNRTWKRTLVNGTGTASCYVDGTTGLPAMCTVYTFSFVSKGGSSGTITATGSLIVTGRNWGVKVEGVATVDLTFQVTGAVTYTAS